MNTIEILTSLFFHTIIIIPLYKKIMNIYNLITQNSNKEKNKKILSEFIILVLMASIASLVYYYMIYIPQL